MILFQQSINIFIHTTFLQQVEKYIQLISLHKDVKENGQGICK